MNEPIGQSIREVVESAQRVWDEHHDPERTARENALVAAERRRELLERADPAITTEDLARLRAGRIRGTPAVRAVVEWLKPHVDPDPTPGSPPARVLVLLGSIGCGKTLAAAYALSRRPGRYVTSERLRALSVARTPKDRIELEQLHRTGLLVIDDIGMEADPGSAKTAVFDALNARQAGPLTILTGNLAIDAYEAWLDPRTLSRVKQIGKVVQVAGADLRRTGA